jgi:hypothetical protein
LFIFQFPFQLQDANKRMLIAKIKSIEAADLNAAIEGKPTKPSHISNWSAIAKFMCHI